MILSSGCSDDDDDEAFFSFIEKILSSVFVLLGFFTLEDTI